ncbi:transposase [Candidatus Hadarchaeum sp.]|uniref:transposase n=1 Tax=Candidatus Hadarchaeum sp. TaxID=2883567 RepID=UPI00385779D9
MGSRAQDRGERGKLRGSPLPHTTVSRVIVVLQERVQTFWERCLKARYAVLYWDMLFVKTLRLEAGIRK